MKSWQQIFTDAFLTNAYIGDERVKIDSLNIYEPILRPLWLYDP